MRIGIGSASASSWAVDAKVRRRGCPHIITRSRRAMSTMTNVHVLLPCALCTTRMAVPGGPVCTICDAVSLPAMVPDDVGTLALVDGP